MRNFFSSARRWFWPQIVVVPAQSARPWHFDFINQPQMLDLTGVTTCHGIQVLGVIAHQPCVVTLTSRSPIETELEANQELSTLLQLHRI